jgi:hypothetical protein
VSKVGKIGAAAIAIGLMVAALPFALPCEALNSGGCGDGQALLIYPFLGLSTSALGFLLLLGSLIARLLKPTNPESSDEKVNS